MLKQILLLTGGIIHDWKGCGDELERILRSSSDLAVTRVDDDLFVLSPDNLAKYDVMVLYWTRGELSDAQRDALLGWVASGKGFVGVHSATASFRECSEFHQMLGGLFTTHPAPRDYRIEIVGHEHPITRGVAAFDVHDEQYIMDLEPDLHVLATARFEGEDIPAVWTKSWGDGRVYFLALGHDPAACRHPSFAELLTRGTLWAAKE